MARRVNPACAAPARLGRDIRVRGVVQGVGYRPTVWRLAREHGIDGSVRNDSDGVWIHAWGDAPELLAFIEALRSRAPPLARVDEVEVGEPAQPDPGPGFVIAPSVDGAAATYIKADSATCPDCLREIGDARDRRHGYAFTNCTHCGPRLSIQRRIPYDRAGTSMGLFTMCEDCRREFEDPADRRFHAQPNACPRCGPALWLEVDGRRQHTADPVALAARLLRAGCIVAVKGLGGYQLAVDATNADAVARLRRRKRRPARPLALIARDLDVVRRWRKPTPEQEQALAASAAPIVLLEDPGELELPRVVAPGSAALGFMLPMTPLHHLLLAGFGHPLVLTSGNPSGQPQCTGDDEARSRLAGIADALLGHDREVVNRVDDSVLRCFDGVPRPLRRARGYAPEPLRVPLHATRRLLALGADLKNTFCLLRDDHAVLSQHIGDLDDPATRADWQRTLELYLQLFGGAPQALVVDRHPDYASSRHGRDWAARLGIELVEVQHHHAHAAACMADCGHAVDGGRVLALVLDGLGWGDDSSAWGAELLHADYVDAPRVARLQPAALPGGDAASREPWRNLAAQLLLADPDGTLRARHAGELRRLHDKPLRVVQRMIESGVNSPPASSCGRLFDAVAAALDLCFDAQSYEGQAAAELEQLALRSDDAAAYPFAVARAGELDELRTAPMWHALLHDRARGVDAARIARRFHLGLAQAWCELLLEQARRLRCPRVALSGGVFQNRLLFETMLRRLRAEGLQVLAHRAVPSNDGGVALGQAVVAAARYAAPAVGAPRAESPSRSGK